MFKGKLASEKRASFKKSLKERRSLRFVGAYSPLVALMIEELGFSGVYVSGGVMANDLGLPDIGLTTLDEVSKRSFQITRVTSLPTLVDVDTGFGDVLNFVRTVKTMEDLGISAIHLEDQTNPKRCGHLDNKELVHESELSKKIAAGVEARTDENFLIIARTDARSVEGFDRAVERAKHYVDAGADAIFPEALSDFREFEKFRKEIPIPLLANMTEFGKSDLLTFDELENLGYEIVIYPVTTQRLALKGVENGLMALKKEGHQKNVLDKMQTRKELYQLINYEGYSQFDNRIFNFKLK